MFQADDPANYAGYNNERFDTIMVKASTVNSSAERAQLLREAENVLVEDVPVIPLYFYVSKHLVRREVFGWTSNILDIHESQYLAPVREDTKRSAYRTGP
jgi:ABC-type oligopeptide transport system substrate-binding subunit